MSVHVLLYACKNSVCIGLPSMYYVTVAVWGGRSRCRLHRLLRKGVVKSSRNRPSLLAKVMPMLADCTPVLIVCRIRCGVALPIDTTAWNCPGNAMKGVGICDVAHATFPAVVSGIDLDAIAVVSEECNGFLRRVVIKCRCIGVVIVDIIMSGSATRMYRLWRYYS